MPDSDTLLFRDGERKIDYILAYVDCDSDKMSKRESFENALKEEGLELETEDKRVRSLFWASKFSIRALQFLAGP